MLYVKQNLICKNPLIAKYVELEYPINERDAGKRSSSPVNRTYEIWGIQGMDNTGIRSRRKKYRRRVRNIRVGLTLFVICLIAVAIPVIREMLRKPAQITIQVADIEVTQ